MIVVSNATPLIGLALINRFDLLPQLVGHVHIPAAVYHETVVAGYSAKELVAQADWIHTADIRDKLAAQILGDELDDGEAETIVLAHELKADLVLMDEKKGRRKLDFLGIPQVGTAGILLRAKNKGLIEVVRPELVALRSQGFSLSRAVMENVLLLANEKIR